MLHGASRALLELLIGLAISPLHGFRSTDRVMIGVIYGNAIGLVVIIDFADLGGGSDI